MDDLSVIEPLEKSPPGAAHMLEHRSLKRLMDFLFMPSTHVMPNERFFAESLLLRDWERLPDNVLERLAGRLANATEMGPRLAAKLASCGRIAVSEMLLQFGALDELDLVDIINQGGEKEQMVIAQRCDLSPVVSDLLVRIGNERVVKTLLMNPRAKISAKTLRLLISKAKDLTSLQSALLVRPEISAPEAMNLFWQVPGEVREFILLSYLCDQRSLSGFLDEDIAWQQQQQTLRPADISDERLKTITKQLVNGERDCAIDQLANHARLSRIIAARILNDKGGEAFLVVAKAMGASRAGLNDALMRFVNSEHCIIGSRDRLEPLRGLFDRLSRDQALVALQYWGWDLDN